tara:strand:+ start:6582 stop:7193 length:612 start_codon:yes stop_codon:yes gene_type:complete
MIKLKDMQVFEILTKMDEIVGRTNKIEYLKQFNEHTPLKYILKFNYCKTIKSIIPEGNPPFNDQSEDGPSKASLWQYLSIFPTFVQSNQSMQIKPLQREKIFIEMLEAVEVPEAKMLILAKDRDLEKLYTSLTVEIARESFPDMNIQSDIKVAPLTEKEIQQDLANVITHKKDEIKKLQEEVKKLTKEVKITKDEPKSDNISI